MNTYTLTDTQREKLLSELASIKNERGAFDFSAEIDDVLTIEGKGYIEIDGYVEDDERCGYMNGTGGWVETWRNATIELEAWVYDPEKEDSEKCYIDRESEKEAEEYLNAA
ncbi:MAG: hypothetical protein IKO85_05225 [Bacteroidaceae bacterium]|nr:hypothetical protein [Bacteroidaceae bacterium]